MAPWTTGTIRVVRTAWVPDTGTNDYLRYFDTFENTGTSTVSVTAEYRGNLGSDSSTVTLSSSSGDIIVGPTDTWYCTHDSSMYDTPACHVWWDGMSLGPTTMTLSGDNLTTSFDFDISPGQTVALIIFPIQMPTRPEAQATAEWILTLVDDPLTGLTGAQRMMSLNWQAGGAPIIHVTTETLEVEEGGTLDLAVDVTDLEGDSFDVYWELTGDGAYDDGTGLTATFSAVGLDGPDTATVGVKAVDSGGEERTIDIPLDVINVPPVFISDPAVDPGLTCYRGTEWIHYIVVEDPANYDDVELDYVLLDIVEKPSGMIFFGDGHLEWTPKIDGSDTGLHTLRIEADDRESDEPTVQEVTLEVMENAPPSAPGIVSPAATTVWETQPTLVVENATDIDGDPLSYHFEVASTGDFATILARGDVFEGTGGQTSWTVSTVLADATRYHWRAWCNDGRMDGPSASTYFDVDTSAIPPDASTDALTDIPTDGWTPPGWGDSGSCGCRIPGSGTGGAAAAWTLPALLALAWMRRRR